MASISIVSKSEIQLKGRFDSEFYQIEYSTLDDILSKTNASNLSKYVNYIKKGIFDISPTKYRNTGIPLIRTTQIKTFFCNEDNLVFIAEDEHKKFYSKTELVAGDILFTKIGAGIGDTSILTTKHRVYNYSQNVAGASIKHELIDPWYLITFLSTRYGRKQILRYMMPSGQGKLELKDIKKILIPRFNESENEISLITRRSYALKDQSEQLYKQAQQLLEDALGLDNLVLDKPKSYEASFSEIVSTNRFDADYYQTHFRQQQKHISAIPTKPLRQIVDFKKGIEVGTSSYTDEGKLFVRVSNVKENGVVTTNSDKYIDEKTYHKLIDFRPNIGNVLLTKDGTLGVCYVIDEEIDGIISGGIMKMTIKDKTVPAEYLSLVINSSICKFQTEQACSGALILHWKPRDIAALKVPILSEDIMQKLSDLVIESKKARKESEQLLEQAKRKVEELIEGGTES